MTEVVGTADAETATRRFLTFRIGTRAYAVPAEEIAEVIRMPPVARLPQSPKALLGLANLRGSVLPVASVRRLLGLDDGACDRMIVLEGAAPVALAVDAVDALVRVQAERIETGRAALSAEPGEALTGAFQLAGSDELAKVLDVRSLLETALRARPRPPRAVRVAAQGHKMVEAAADRVRFATFEVAGQEYGLALEHVHEIIPAPASAVTPPRADSAVLGVAPYRDGLLPLLSLRSLLGFAADQAPPATAKVVVARVAGALVGLMADRTCAILAAERERIEVAPPILAARAGGESRIAAIYRPPGGGRLVSILQPDRLFREDIMQRLAETSGAPARGETSAADDERALKILVFRLGEEELGLPIEAVDEVAPAPERIARVPKTPAFLEGVVNLRGQVLPIVDQRKRFGMSPLADGSRRRLVVVRAGGHRAGILVDAVSEVLRTARDRIEAAPDLVGETTQLVQGVVNLETAGRMILLLDPAELLTRAERGLLDAFAAEPVQADS